VGLYDKSFYRKYDTKLEITLYYWIMHLEQNKIFQTKLFLYLPNFLFSVIYSIISISHVLILTTK